MVVVALISDHGFHSKLNPLSFYLHSGPVAPRHGPCFVPQSQREALAWGSSDDPPVPSRTVPPKADCDPVSDSSLSPTSARITAPPPSFVPKFSRSRASPVTLIPSPLAWGTSRLRSRSLCRNGTDRIRLIS